MVGVGIDNNVVVRSEKFEENKKDGLKGLFANPYVTGVAIFASLGGFLFGYDQGVMSNVLTQENFGQHFPRIYLSPGIKGWVVSVLELGAWLGALMNGYFADRLSRKYSMILAIFIFTLGAGLQTGAHNEGYIFTGRFLGGIGVGMLSMVVPMYQSEISPPAIRGSLVALQQFAITVGILVSFWIDYGTHFIGGTRCTPDIPYSRDLGNGEFGFDPRADAPNGCTGQKTISWRLPIGLQIVPAWILAIGMLFFPFSPRWLMMKGREQESLEVVAKLRRLPIDSEVVQTEWKEIKASCIFDQRTSEVRHPGMRGFKLSIAEYTSLLTRRPWFKRLAIGCLVQFFQQFTGINAIIYYSPTIFSSLGLDPTTTSLLATGVVGIVNTVFTIPAILYLDSFGRRKILMCGALGMFVAHIIVAGIIGGYQDDWPNHKAQGWVGVAFIYVFIASFATSWGPLGWVLPSEIFPLGIRSKAISITTSANWMMNFVIGLATPQMIDKISYGTYIFFAFWCLLSFFWVYFFVPETKHKGLEEMDAVFKDNTTGEDNERMRKINKELGLDEDAGLEKPASSGDQTSRVKEKGDLEADGSPAASTSSAVGNGDSTVVGHTH